MAVNVNGIWNCCKAAVPALRQSGGGSIINVASLAATYGMPFALHYTTSKAAVIGLTRGLARELGRDNIRVNALAPSAVLTDGTREFFGDRLDRALDVIKSGQSIQRTLSPPDLVGTALWLVSDAAAKITGRRFLGVHWDAALPPEQAAEKAGAPVAWTSIATMPITPSLS